MLVLREALEAQGDVLFWDAALGDSMDDGLEPIQI